jgi:hypothetical protein
MIFVPFGIIPFCQPVAASWLGTRLSAAAVVLVEPLTRAAQDRLAFDPFSAEVVPASAGVERDPQAAGAVLDDEGDVVEPNPGITGGRPLAGRNAKISADGKTKPLPSVRVSQAVVLRLAQTATRPSGKPVAASGGRPAGIQVFGVSALGIGVRDGDVLTHVSGVPVTNAGQVVMMVILARGARAREMTGRLWRGKRSYTLVVEQPYPPNTDEKPANRAALSGDELRTGKVSLDGF